MPIRDARVDAYIAKAPPFAQPILAHLRAAVHEACPDVEETIKWGMPSFTYHGILAGMAAFTTSSGLPRPSSPPHVPSAWPRRCSG
jgi:hypothetical protein